MPLQKQTVSINFSQGLETKTDPFQLPIGRFLKLENSIFQTPGQLQPRNGYAPIINAPDNSAYLTTLNGNLLAVGETISAEAQSLDQFITKGTLQPCSLNVTPLIRNNLNQIQTDSITANGMTLVVYTQQNSPSGLNYLYAIEDAATQQNIISPSAIPALPTGAISGSSRVFVSRNNFVIVSPVLIGGTTFLQYVSIPLFNPVLISTAQNTFPEAYVPISTNPGWDGVTDVNDSLVLAYNTTAGGQAVHITVLTASQIAGHQVSSLVHSFAGSQASILSLAIDLTPIPNLIYISFWSSVSTNGFTGAVFLGFGTITTQFSPAAIITGVVISNLASAAQNGSALVFSEVVHNYAYDSAIPTHFINGVTVSDAGVVGTPYVVVRSVGLASKAFIVNQVIYFLSAFQSPFQPSYFLINGSTSISANPIIVAKLAYQNGGGYLALGLPGVTIIDSAASFSYLFKQNVEALNTLNNTQQTAVGGIYSQLGINEVSIELGTQNIDSAEIAQNLYLSGGFLSMFDSFYPVEQNFFVFPDSIEATWSATGGAIEAQPDGITNTNAYAYQVVYEWTDMKGNAFFSTPSIPIFVTTTGAGTTGSITVHIPTLRLTLKIPNKVKIVLYRWSVSTQVYNQVTSIFAPILNDTTIDSIDFIDLLADASVIGNSIIYTTGGVVPDVNGPATDLVTIFDTRLFLVDSEDRNLLWVSKTVIEGTPVELSSFFTIFIAPNTGTTQSSGPMTALFPMDDKLIVFKKNAIFFMNGTGPDNLGTTSPGCPLGNYSPPVFITSVVGCINQKSIVLTQDGLMFQSDKGIWLLSRSLQTSYIGSPVEAFNGFLVTSANVIPDKNFVLFTLNTNTILMYDYYAKQWGTWTAPGSILSSCIYQGEHTYLNQYGQVLQQTPGNYLDAGDPVLMSFVTSWFNLAGLMGYQRFYDLYILGVFESPHELEVQIAYDYNSSLYHSSLITPNNYSPVIPGPFGIQTPFGALTQLLYWRIHAKKQLCQSFQVTVQEVFNPAYQTIPGAGFTLSGMVLNVATKRPTKPLRGSLAVG